MGGKRWSKEEIDFLTTFWGSYNLVKMSKKLNRTVDSVKVKSERLGLGGSLRSQDSITKADIKKICKVTDYTVEKWIASYGLKCTKKVLAKKRCFCLIKLKDFWEFAFNNNELIDFSKIEKNILGIEPVWVDDFRKRDFRVKRKPYVKKWSESEIKEAIRLYKNGLSCKEISEKLDRSYHAVQIKLMRLGYKRRSHVAWRDEEMKIIKNLIEKGYTDYAIGKEIGRSSKSVCKKRSILLDEIRVRKRV